MPNEFDFRQSASRPGIDARTQARQLVGRNIYMTPDEQAQYAQDVMGGDPYYRMMRGGPAEYQFPPGIETDEQAYEANVRAMQQNSVPSEFAQSMWMRQTPRGMVYTTADKLFYGSDYTDQDLSRRERAVRAQGWMPAIEGGYGIDTQE